MTARSRTDVQDELEQQLVGGKAAYGKYEGAQVVRLVVTPQKGVTGKLRTHLLPFSADAGNTKMYVSYNTDESHIIGERSYPDHDIENVAGEGNGVLSIEFATTDPEELEARLQNFPDILSDVIDPLGVPEDEGDDLPKS